MNKRAKKLQFTKIDTVLIWLLPPVIGTVIGWLLPTWAGAASKLPWIPFIKGPLDLIASFDSPWTIVVTTILGIITGIILTILAYNYTLMITITTQKLSFGLEQEVWYFLKKDIQVVFMEGKEVIVLSNDDIELFRCKTELKARHIKAALAEYDYLFAVKNPFENEFKKWVPELPELSRSAHALLKARERSVKENDLKNCLELSIELAKIGISVRDRNQQQYFRKSKLTIN